MPYCPLYTDAIIFQNKKSCNLFNISTDIHMFLFG